MINCHFCSIAKPDKEITLDAYGNPVCKDCWEKIGTGEIKVDK